MFIFRNAVPEDCGTILKLIKELAAFERMPDGPKINEHVLQKDGFGENPLFQCIVAETDGQNLEKKEIIGYAIFYYTYSTWEGKALYMEDIYVTPAFRNKGVGTSLWSHVAKVAVKSGCCRLDFAVFNWNELAISFYVNKGAEDITKSEGWHHYRLKQKELQKLAAM